MLVYAHNKISHICYVVQGIDYTLISQTCVVQVQLYDIV